MYKNPLPCDAAVEKDNIFQSSIVATSPAIIILYYKNINYSDNSNP